MAPPSTRSHQAEELIPAPAVEVVDLKRFLQATRDSGYRSFDAAIAELVDNSLQANAQRIELSLPEPSDDPMNSRVWVLDDGCGMSPEEMSTALQFGGSHRFNDRQGLGRFGMGLPNSSLSQARRVDVYSWKRSGEIWHTFLDLDELLVRCEPFVPTPTPARLPYPLQRRRQKSGTLVVWSKLDRIKHSTWRLMARRLSLSLGRKFRYFLWAGRAVMVNGGRIAAFDPLFLSQETRSGWIMATPYGKELEYPIQLPADSGEVRSALITVRFSELPVWKLAGITNQDKRVHGIANGAGVSVVRADREIDYGWFFLNKRRENYDDWWRCEVRFNPELDELFGVTHTKQSIRPTEDLKAILCNELTAIARTLNRRVRVAHMEFGAEKVRNAAAHIASGQDLYLRPLTDVSTSGEVVGEAAAPTASVSSGIDDRKYRIAVEDSDDPNFYRVELCAGEVVIFLNRHHEFYKRVYEPLAGERANKHPEIRVPLELLLMAVGRAELQAQGGPAEVRRFVEEWSRALAVFCRGYEWRP